MKMNVKSGIGAMLTAMLLVSMVFSPAVSAQPMQDSKQETKITIEPNFELEQGLVDALNSNLHNASKDDIISNYINNNKEKIEAQKDVNIATLKGDELRSYTLKDGSDIIFSGDWTFYVSEIKEEEQINPLTKAGISYTPIITHSYSAYSWVGPRLFSIYTKGYFEYDGTTVEAHHMDSWYTRGTLSVWQVSNWEEGKYDHSSGTYSEFYGRGNFYFGFEIDGGNLILQDEYINLYVKCDEGGDYEKEMTKY
jgi:hypothetical protein